MEHTAESKLLKRTENKISRHRPIKKTNGEISINDNRKITIDQIQMKSIIQMGRGADIMNQGGNNYVIKINFAGSKYGAWNKAKNPKGYGRKKFIKKNVFSLPFRRPSFIDLSRTEARFQNIYGIKKGGQSHRTYKKNKSINTRPYYTYSISGPQWLWGGSDNGGNSIAKNIKNGTDILEREINNIYRYNTNANIHILIKGHSRGGVAAGRVAQIIKSKYPHRKNLYIELVQYDPVPGPCHQGRNVMLELNKDYNDKEDSQPISQEREFNPTDKIPNISSTLIYSLNSGHKCFFTPQQVMNADRIILSDLNHTSGLNLFSDDNGKKHKQGFKMGSTPYRGSNINDLPAGVYHADTNGELTEISNIQAFDELIASQRNLEIPRKEIITKVVTSKLV